MRDTLGPALDKAFQDTHDSGPDDGLQEFAIFAERRFDLDEYHITKIVPFDRNARYPVACVGVVRAKDELDAWRFARSYVEDRDRWDRLDRATS